MNSSFDVLGRLFSADGFVPRRVCGLWPDWLVWEHVAGNALVWLTYVAMPLMIWRLGGRRPDWKPFQGVVQSFAVFIGLCGMGHFLDMVAFFRPMYRLTGHVLIATGLVSGWTAWSLRRAWPALMALKSPAELERIIAERTAALTGAIDELERVEFVRAYLATIVESSQDAIIGNDFDGVLTTWNGGAERLFGYNAVEVVGRPASFLVPGDRLDEETAILARLRAGERIPGHETVRLARGGCPIEVSLSISPIEDRSGRIIGISTIVVDITERKRSEAKIRLLNEDLERRVRERTAELGQRVRLIDQAHDAILVHCMKGVITSWNQGAERIYGWTSEEAVGRASHELLETRFPGPLTEIEDELARLGSWDGELSHRRKDGVRIVVASRWVLDREASGVGAILEINSDITERRASEEALRRSELALRESQRLAGVGSWEWYPDADRFVWSDELYRIAALDPSRPAPTVAEQARLYTAESMARWNARMATAVEEGEPYEVELEMVCGDGVNRWIVSRGEAVRDPDGRVASLRGTALDVSARKRFEGELRHARDEAMAATIAKSEFLANMSHEIRTPMNGVLGMTELLLDTQLNDLQRGYAETIHSSGEALLTVINDILDFSKIEAGKLTLESTSFDLRSLMEEVADLLAPRAHQKNMDIVSRVARTVPGRLVGDPVRIRQVLTNLAGNAVKFTERGAVDLEAYLLSEEGGRATIRILVRDTGIGIPEDRQADIFESFTQIEGGNSRRHGGTGLGLTICRSLVTLMGGRIGLESRPGFGSIFWFELALDREDEEADIRAVDFEGLRVLIVDDQETSRAILREDLLSWGCRTEVVTSGAEALAMLLGNPDDDPFGLILLDQKMPGMDGEQTARAIKAAPRYANVPLVTLGSITGLGTGEVDDSLWAARLSKPVRRCQLYSTLCRAIAATRSLHAHPPADAAGGLNATTPLRILLAEDNEVNRRVVIGMVERLGFGVEAVRDGREAIDTLDYDRHDVVLMDVQMPEIDGITATIAIRDRERGTGRHVPIIALTAHAMQGDRERCLAAGMDGYVSKPIRSGPLREALHEWMVKDGTPTCRAEGQPVPEFRFFSAETFEDSCGSDPRLTLEVLGLMLGGVPPRLDRLEAALAAEDGRQVSWQAHDLKAEFAMVGAEALASACRELMTLGDGGDFAAIRKVYRAVRNQWEGLEEEATRYLDLLSVTGSVMAR